MPFSRCKSPASSQWSMVQSFGIIGTRSTDMFCAFPVHYILRDGDLAEN